MHHAFPIGNTVVIEEGKIADHESTEDAYKTLRTARSDARLIGKREKRAKAKEEEAAAQKK
jgi:large subunit ribosomal protein L13e